MFLDYLSNIPLSLLLKFFFFFTITTEDERSSIQPLERWVMSINVDLSLWIIWWIRKKIVNKWPTNILNNNMNKISFIFSYVFLFLKCTRYGNQKFSMEQKVYSKRQPKLWLYLYHISHRNKEWYILLYNSWFVAPSYIFILAPKIYHII